MSSENDRYEPLRRMQCSLKREDFWDGYDEHEASDGYLLCKSER